MHNEARKKREKELKLGVLTLTINGCCIVVKIFLSVNVYFTTLSFKALFLSRIFIANNYSECLSLTRKTYPNVPLPNISTTEKFFGPTFEIARVTSFDNFALL